MEHVGRLLLRGCDFQRQRLGLRLSRAGGFFVPDCFCRQCRTGLYGRGGFDSRYRFQHRAVRSYFIFHREQNGRRCWNVFYKHWSHVGRRLGICGLVLRPLRIREAKRRRLRLYDDMGRTDCERRERLPDIQLYGRGRSRLYGSTATGGCGADKFLNAAKSRLRRNGEGAVQYLNHQRLQWRRTGRRDGLRRNLHGQRLAWTCDGCDCLQGQLHRTIRDGISNHAR